jgi:shikimate kinase
MYYYSDKLVEQAVGMPSVAQIFKVHSEAFFRDNEVENSCLPFFPFNVSFPCIVVS